MPRGSQRFGASLARILDATPDLVGAADRDYRAVYMNCGGRRLLGVGEHEEVTGADVLAFYPPDDARLIATVAFPTALATGSWAGDVVLVSRDGRQIPVHQIILTFESETGEKLFTTFARDIGLRKAREVRLAESEERFRSTFEQAAVGIAQLAIDGRFLWFNAKLCAILEETRQEL
ncbi:MAG TPA: PAS domain S-box protein, partial [Thermoanaerobaculia bacterium]